MRKILSVLIPTLALTVAGVVIAVPAEAATTLSAPSITSLYTPTTASVTTTATTAYLQILASGSWVTISTKTKTSILSTVYFDITRKTGTGQYYYRAKVKFSDGTTSTSVAVGVYYNGIPTPGLTTSSTVIPYGASSTATATTYATKVTLQYLYGDLWVNKETKTKSATAGSIQFDISATSTMNSNILTLAYLPRDYRVKAEFSGGEVKYSPIRHVCYDGKYIGCI